MASFKLHYLIDQKDGKDYIRFRPVETRLKFDKIRFYLKNLFNGDPALESIGNQAVNSNPHILMEEVRPSLENYLRKSLTLISNAVVEGATEQELLPP